MVSLSAFSPKSIIKLSSTVIKQKKTAQTARGKSGGSAHAKPAGSAQAKPSAEEKSQGWTSNALIAGLTAAIVSSLMAWFIADKVADRQDNDVKDQARSSEQVQQVEGLESDALVLNQETSFIALDRVQCVAGTRQGACSGPRIQVPILRAESAVQVDISNISNPGLRRVSNSFLKDADQALDYTDANSLSEEEAAYAGWNAMGASYAELIRDCGNFVRQNR